MLIELPDYSVIDALREPFAFDTNTVVVIPTNAQGIFGAGVAKLVRLGLPDVESLVCEAIRDKQVLSSSVLQTCLTNHPHITIAIIPTKKQPSDAYSKLVDVARGIDTVLANVPYDSVVVMPRIVTGHGWTAKDGKGVRLVIEESAKHHDIRVVIAEKYENFSDISEGFGVDRKVYDFCVHGWGFGKENRPRFYNMTNDGLDVMVNTNPDKFPNDGRYTGRSLLRKMGLLRGDHAIDSSLFNLFDHDRNHLGNMPYGWRELFHHTKGIRRSDITIDNILDDE